MRASSALPTGGGAMAPAPPPLATEIFGDRLEVADRYVRWLVGPGVERGLVGPRESERIWDRHIVNCAAVGALIEPNQRVVDIGSGAGLPGLVLAIARPDLRVVLVESMLRRTAFLTEVVEDLGLSSVSVTRGRAEELHAAKLQADVVTARAVAPLDKLAAWAAPLLAEPGVVLALKGSGLAEEVVASWTALRRSRLTGEASAWAVVAAASVATRSASGSASESASGSAGVERPMLAEAGRPLLRGLHAVEQGRWTESAEGCRFDPAEVEAADESERLALVIRLGRFPQALSRASASGLG